MTNLNLDYCYYGKEEKRMMDGCRVFGVCVRVVHGFM